MVTASVPAIAMGGPPVPVTCISPPGVDTVVNCTGNLKDGVPIVITAPITPEMTLNVFDVDGDITPAGQPGIWLTIPGDAIINSDPGSNRIVTTDSAPGILGQGQSVTIHHRGDISATGYNSFGIFAYSDLDVKATLDAKAGPAGGQAITIDSQGDIEVGKFSAGIAAAAVTGAVSVTSRGNITGGAYSSGIMAVNNGPGTPLHVWGNGEVRITSTGNITLNDRHAGDKGTVSELESLLPDYNAGIVAYNGGTESTFVVSNGNISTTGNDRKGIDAYSFGHAELQVVDVRSAGNITTTGDRAHGIEAAAEYADIVVVSKGDITTTGEIARGITAYSNWGGTVDVTSTGDINAPGADSYGIKIAGYSNLTVTVKGGTVYGGLAGVVFFAGKNNLLVNYGTIASSAGGSAVEGDTIGDELIENYGVISGDVALATEESSSWSNIFGTPPAGDSFRNHAGALFNSGAYVQLGNNGLLLNEGVINPGGAGVVATTELEGLLEQTGSGAIEIDIKGKSADRITITSAAPPGVPSSPASKAAVFSASLAGKIIPVLQGFDTSSLSHQFTIVSGSGALADQGLSVSDTALADYSLLFAGNELILKLDAHFSAEGLNQGQGAVLGYLGSLIGTPDAATLETIYTAFLSLPDSAAVGALTDGFTSDAGANGLLGLASSQAFAQALRSCPVAEGPYGQQRETSCVWATPNARELRQDASFDKAGIDSNSSGLMGGVQTQLHENVWGGLGFAIEKNSAVIDTTLSDGTWWQAGGVLKWVQGPWKLSGSLSGGQGNIDMTRFAGAGAVADSSTDVTVVTSLARLAYSFEDGGFYVTPMVDLGASYLRMDGFTETGAGLFNLAAASSSEWIISGGPAVEIGATVQQQGLTFRPFVKAGVMFLSRDSFDVAARFASLPSSAGGFVLASGFDDVYATVDAGVTLFSADSINLKLSYEGRFGEDSRQNGVDAKLSINY